MVQLYPVPSRGDGRVAGAEFGGLGHDKGLGEMLLMLDNVNQDTCCTLDYDRF